MKAFRLKSSSFEPFPGLINRKITLAPQRAPKDLLSRILEPLRYLGGLG